MVYDFLYYRYQINHFKKNIEIQSVTKITIRLIRIT